MASPLPWRLVTVDIDGTLTRGHGWRPIAEAFGRLPAYEATNRRFFAHEIGEDQHLDDLLDLAAGRTVAEVEAVLAATPRLDGIQDGVAALRAAGIRTALLTHNPDYVCAWYQRTFGFDDFEGTAGPEVRNGVLTRPGPVRADKLGGLVRLLDRARVPARSAIHLGDGWSDAEVFERVGGGIAVNCDLPEVERRALRTVRTARFGDLVAAIRETAPRT